MAVAARTARPRGRLQPDPAAPRRPRDLARRAGRGARHPLPDSRLHRARRVRAEPPPRAAAGGLLRVAGRGDLLARTVRAARRRRAPGARPDRPEHTRVGESVSRRAARTGRACRRRARRRRAGRRAARPDARDEPGQCLGGVDRVDQEPLGPGEEAGRLVGRGGRPAVARAELRRRRGRSRSGGDGSEARRPRRAP